MTRTAGRSRIRAKPLDLAVRGPSASREGAAGGVGGPQRSCARLHCSPPTPSSASCSVVLPGETGAQALLLFLISASCSVVLPGEVPEFLCLAPRVCPFWFVLIWFLTPIRSRFGVHCISQKRAWHFEHWHHPEPLAAERMNMAMLPRSRTRLHQRSTSTYPSSSLQVASPYVSSSI